MSVNEKAILNKLLEHYYERMENFFSELPPRLERYILDLQKKVKDLQEDAKKRDVMLDEVSRGIADVKWKLKNTTEDPPPFFRTTTANNDMTDHPIMTMTAKRKERDEGEPPTEKKKQKTIDFGKNSIYIF